MGGCSWGGALAVGVRTGGPGRDPGPGLWRSGLHRDYVAHSHEDEGQHYQNLHRRGAKAFG